MDADAPKAAARAESDEKIQRRGGPRLLDALKDFVYALARRADPTGGRAGEGRGMPRGHIDALTTSGLVTGWAVDEAKPLTPLDVAIVAANGEDIAGGQACHWREDLARAGLGFGWCAFRLALSVAPQALIGRPLRLVVAETRAVLFEGAPPLMDRGEDEIRDLDALIAADPTLLRSPEQLESLAPALDAFVAAQGVEAFVRAAYIYVLGRHVDPSGLASFGRHIRSRRLTPYAMLLSLAEGQEFAERGRRVAAPNRPGFPFLAP